MSNRVFLTFEQAIEMLPEGDNIHTFRSSIPGIIIGADISRKCLYEKMKAYQIELSGSQATRMNHGIVLTDKTGPLFIETNGHNQPLNSEREKAELNSESSK